MSRPALLLAHVLLMLAACAETPDKPGTVDEQAVAAKAVADVDGARADAARVPPPVK